MSLKIKKYKYKKVNKPKKNWNERNENYGYSSYHSYVNK